MKETLSLGLSSPEPVAIELSYSLLDLLSFRLLKFQKQKQIQNKKRKQKIDYSMHWIMV